MKDKEFNWRVNKLGLLFFVATAACLIISGCASFGPNYLNKEVIKYDDAVLQSEQQLLLLNILRMHDDQPVHFTSANSIQASFTLSSPNSLTGSIKNNDFPAPTSLGAGISLGGTITNNPSITIAPVQGKDFAERFLSPIDTKFVWTIFLQHGELDKLLRLAGVDFYMIGPKKSAEIFDVIKNAEGIDKPKKKKSAEGTNNPNENKTEDKKIFKNAKDFKGLEMGYKYPFDGLKNLKDNNGLPSDEAISKLTKEGFSSEEARCLLSEEDCYMKNTPPKIMSLEDKNIIKREDDALRYKLFRRIVLHIKAVQLSDGLYYTLLDIPVQNVKGTFRKDIDFGKDGFKDAVDLYEKQYFWHDMTKDSNEPPKTESKEVTKTESKEVTKSESKEVIKKENTEVTKTESKEVTAKSEKKEAAELAKPEGAYILEKNYTVMALTDFDYTLIDDQDKQIIVKKIQDDLAIDEEIKLGESVILVLLRGGGDNRWPIYGYFALRNFRQVLQFLAESITDQPGYAAEYYVPPSSFTNDLINRFNEKPHEARVSLGCLENPAQTLAIYNSKVQDLNHPLVSVDYNGLSYWIATRQKRQEPTKWTDPYPLRWDGQVFSMLYEMFEYNKNAPAFTSPVLTIPTK